MGPLTRCEQGLGLLATLSAGVSVTAANGLQAATEWGMDKPL